MERLLLLWDEWDDFTGACRHLAASTASELTGVTTTVATQIAAAASAMGVWVSATVTAFFR
jgi:hypothetical protein